MALPSCAVCCAPCVCEDIRPDDATGIWMKSCMDCLLRVSERRSVAALAEQFGMWLAVHFGSLLCAALCSLCVRFDVYVLV